MCALCGYDLRRGSCRLTSRPKRQRQRVAASTAILAFVPVKLRCDSHACAYQFLKKRGYPVMSHGDEVVISSHVPKK